MKYNTSGLVLSGTYGLGKGWSARIEQSHGNNGNGKGKHVHLIHKTKGSYAQNDDGSPHDKNNNKKGSPPEKARLSLKDKTGWDWEENYNSHINKATYLYCGMKDRGFYTYASVYQAIYPDGTIRYAYETALSGGSFSPSTDRLREVYENGMSNNPIKNNSGYSDSPSVIYGPTPFSGPVTYPSFVPTPIPVF